MRSDPDVIMTSAKGWDQNELHPCHDRRDEGHEHLHISKAQGLVHLTPLLSIDQLAGGEKGEGSGQPNGSKGPQPSPLPIGGEKGHSKP